ncbi:hypothetical protein [Armatimonas rosea]|uniref:Uncharacterized protein n=1 Tax=Armatimonas rosea TaxID=685828 RepID=A0A7W9W8W3_ARMRO|nr:hypothetical protein [Armatimonas rosea]MBB6052560.1 hypothetical protein [Armatimonas rosea]
MRLKSELALVALAALTTLPLMGCPSPQSSAPPPAPPAQTAPAGRPAGLPDLPPDPRAVRAGGGSATSASSAGSVGTLVLPSKPVPGSALNKFFPGDSDGFKRIFTQEKNGTSLANLTKDGKTVATLSISDTAGNPSARDKFKSAGRSVAGNPATNDGMSGIAVLVGDRYQVKVRASGPTLSDSDLQSWVEKFDLAGLAGLK